MTGGVLKRDMLYYSKLASILIIIKMYIKLVILYMKRENTLRKEGGANVYLQVTTWLSIFVNEKKKVLVCGILVK